MRKRMKRRGHTPPRRGPTHRPRAHTAQHGHHQRGARQSRRVTSSRVLPHPRTWQRREPRHAPWGTTVAWWFLSDIVVPLVVSIVGQILATGLSLLLRR